MKYITSEQSLEVPEGVTVEIKARNITVTGPRGTLKKNLQHVDVTFKKVNDKLIKLYILHGSRKQVAALRTVKSLVHNMIVGVTKGFKYKMRYVYAHFPINVNIENNGAKVEIRNYLGEKQVRIVNALEGVKVEISKGQKDELILTGNSVENVSQTAADIQQICKARNKDIRKFLDGIYVSEKGVIEQDA
ncbi:60S ribosomal protein L9-A [Wickerhamiella sorbophila]|uniref:60S ribosomal protein L9-A n=1 Tax=Wickerhamiella sorbophila TaxID=45607 RepID=A0A2T0FJY2_9ASCO|nr:60S ribosomal protein L9-A [Wickerhamiella sorbophila]PRT55277.1 60S ribosomal protein L9-A [Wickerhamiella sorbophila]